MRHLIMLTTIIVLIAACAPQVDRCTADPNLPDCRAGQAIAQSTIAAANADTEARVRQSYMKATQDAVALHAQATRAVVVISATAQAIHADATRTAMEMDALRNSLAMTATLQAAQGQIVATQTALEGETRLRAATVEADTAGLRQWVWIVTGVAVVVIVAISFTRTTKRTTERVGNAIAVKAENSAAIVRYGLNNAHAGLIDRGPNGELVFKPLDQALAALDYWLPRLAVPDQQKLLAIADYSKRSAVIDGVTATGAWPLLDDNYDDESLPQIATAPAQYAYTIVTPSATAQPISGWLDEVELKLLPSAAPSGG